MDMNMDMEMDMEMDMDMEMEMDMEITMKMNIKIRTRGLFKIPASTAIALSFIHLMCFDTLQKRTLYLINLVSR